jgi:hypothetical protein
MPAARPRCRPPNISHPASHSSSLPSSQHARSYEPGPGFTPCPLPAWAPAASGTPIWLVQLPPDVSLEREVAKSKGVPLSCFFFCLSLQRGRGRLTRLFSLRHTTHTHLQWDPATTVTLQPVPSASGAPGEEVGRGVASDGEVPKKTKSTQGLSACLRPPLPHEKPTTRTCENITRT